MNFDLNLIIYIHFVIICNIYLTRQIYRGYLVYESRKSNSIVLSLVQLTKYETAFILLIASSLTLMSGVHGFGLFYMISFIILLFYQFIPKLIPSEKIHLTDIKKLSLGHGASLWYYKNYLVRFLEQNFSSRIKQFISTERVKLPEILFILFPKSCKVQRYIDNSDIIDWSKELPPWTKDNSGIPKREYNISVYRIQHPLKTFRCALEYAQPLKALFRFREMGRITTSELSLQRDKFTQQLKKFLREDNSADKLCELVEYDDETEEIHDVLYNTNSIQNFISQNKVS